MREWRKTERMNERKRKWVNDERRGSERTGERKRMSE